MGDDLSGFELLFDSLECHFNLSCKPHEKCAGSQVDSADERGHPTVNEFRQNLVGSSLNHDQPLSEFFAFQEDKSARLVKASLVEARTKGAGGDAGLEECLDGVDIGALEIDHASRSAYEREQIRSPLSFSLFSVFSGPASSSGKAALVSADGVAKASEHSCLRADRVDPFDSVQVKLFFSQPAADAEVVAEEIERLRIGGDLFLVASDAEFQLAYLQICRFRQDVADGGFFSYAVDDVVIAHDERNLGGVFLQDGEKTFNVLDVEIFQLRVETDFDVVGQIPGVNDPVGSEVPEHPPQVTVAAAWGVGKVDDQSPKAGVPVGSEKDSVEKTSVALPPSLVHPYFRKIISEKS